eukprot:jgi/Mesen1/2627/ME000166S01755
MALAAFAFLLQWRGGYDDPNTVALIYGEDGAKLPGWQSRPSKDLHRTLAGVDCVDRSKSVAPVFPHQPWRAANGTNDGPKVCITTTTAASLDQILPWLFYHQIIGVSTFFLFVEGAAASPNSTAVLRSIPGVKIIFRTKELEEKQAKSEWKFEEAAVLHYTYSKFSDLTSRRDRCGCKPTKEDVKKCFMLEFDRSAFIIASTSTPDDMLKWYREHVVWLDREVNQKLLKKGLFGRIYTPQTIVRGILASGMVEQAIARGSQAIPADTLQDSKPSSSSSSSSPVGRKTRGGAGGGGGGGRRIGKRKGKEDEPTVAGGTKIRGGGIVGGAVSIGVHGVNASGAVADDDSSAGKTNNGSEERVKQSGGDADGVEAAAMEEVEEDEEGNEEQEQGQGLEGKQRSMDKDIKKGGKGVSKQSNEEGSESHVSSNAGGKLEKKTAGDIGEEKGGVDGNLKTRGSLTGEGGTAKEEVYDERDEEEETGRWNAIQRGGGVEGREDVEGSGKQAGGVAAGRRKLLETVIAIANDGSFGLMVPAVPPASSPTPPLGSNVWL